MMENAWKPDRFIMGLAFDELEVENGTGRAADLPPRIEELTDCRPENRTQ